MTTTKRTTDREAALTRLRYLCPPGATVYTLVRHVSRSGMSRLISAYVIHDGEPQWLDGYISRLGLFKLASGPRDALRVGGCGMDMGFHVVYNLSQALYPEGFGCIGEHCPSNDHSNGDRDYTPHVDDTTHRHYHRSGGYALRQRAL